jgi:phage/plasmid-like protein (TIGR03299 family)
MTANIEVNKDGKARFAYAGNQAPWHRLGQSMSGLQTIDAMLEASQADYQVLLTKIAVVDDEGNLVRNPDGTPVIVEDSKATVRLNDDGSFNPLATVGNRYDVRQNREVLERAMAVVGASKGDAVIDTCGVLKGGARFFAGIDLGSLIIDPTGVNDKIARYLVVSHGHDGYWPIRYANTDVRAVCQNTVILGIKQAERVFTARHTRNADSYLNSAQEALHISTEWAKQFKLTAEQMLSIPVPQSSASVDKVINAVFPVKKDESDIQRRNREEINGTIRALYASQKNAGGFGYNGWSIYNSVVEYLDHYRKGDANDLALATIEENSWTNKAKVTAQHAVLQLV